MFTSQGGTCFSCHYNDVETQTLGRWDDYKYNLYHGITDVAAEEVQVTTSYDQTTITPAENRFFKTVKDEPSEWLDRHSRWIRPSTRTGPSPSTATATIR